MTFRIESADGWIQIARGNLTRALGSTFARRKLELIATAEYHLRKARTELETDILAKAAQKDAETGETYTLPIECRNCSHRFTFTIAKGTAVRRGIGFLEKRKVTSPWTRERIYCPNCGCDRLEKERS